MDEYLGRREPQRPPARRLGPSPRHSERDPRQFSDGWRIDSIEPAGFDVTVDPTGQLHLPTHLGRADTIDVGTQRNGVRAWLATIMRI